MSTTVVGDIHAAIKAQCASSFVSGVELKRVYEPEQNDFRHPNIGYGVRHLSGAPASGVTRVYTIDHSFEVMLAKRFISRDSDDDKQATFNQLYESAHLLFVDMINTKLGLPSSILNIEQLSLSEPEILSNEVALLRAQFVVKYRQALT